MSWDEARMGIGLTCVVDLRDGWKQAYVSVSYVSVGKWTCECTGLHHALDIAAVCTMVQCKYQVAVCTGQPVEYGVEEPMALQWRHMRRKLCA
jgi:hypothetical protein